MRKEIVESVFFGKDPFSEPCIDFSQCDFQGWGSDHPYLAEAVSLTNAKLVIEVGVWKGLSVICLARAVRKEANGGVVLAIDTWLGSEEHWVNQDWHRSLKIRDGRPEMYKTFLANIFKAGVANSVLPIPMDSVNALRVLANHNISADVIHIDAGHDYSSVKLDLETAWPLLRGGGVLICDDYCDEWDEVKLAVDDFIISRQLSILKAEQVGSWKCWIDKK